MTAHDDRRKTLLRRRGITDHQAGYGGLGITTPSKHDSDMQGLIASLEVENAVIERIISLNLVLDELTRLDVLQGEINAALAGPTAL